MYGGKTGLYLIKVEKVIPLYDKRFEQMKNHPLDDCPEIIENRDLMYMEGNTAHCIIFLDANGKWISGYSNVTSGVYRHTMDIPADAYTFVLGYPDNKYATELNLPVFDYLEFISF